MLYIIYSPSDTLEPPTTRYRKHASAFLVIFSLLWMLASLDYIYQLIYPGSRYFIPTLTYTDDDNDDLKLPTHRTSNAIKPSESGLFSKPPPPAITRSSTGSGTSKHFRIPSDFTLAHYVRADTY
jgi:hypothetical protein